jgi:hypothetical protein
MMTPARAWGAAPDRPGVHFLPIPPFQPALSIQRPVVGEDESQDQGSAPSPMRASPQRLLPQLCPALREAGPPAGPLEGSAHVSVRSRRWVGAAARVSEAGVRGGKELSPETRSQSPALLQRPSPRPSTGLRAFRAGAGSAPPTLAFPVGARGPSGRMRARVGTQVSAPSGSGPVRVPGKPVTVTASDWPRFSGRILRQGGARAELRVTGGSGAGQGPNWVRGAAASRSLSPWRPGTVGRLQRRSRQRPFPAAADIGPTWTSALMLKIMARGLG